jgi:hypothetical protein
MIKQIGNKSFLSWDDVEVLVKKLCDKITRSNLDIKDIWGLPRGGLIPAVMVSHKLGIPMTKGTITPDTLIIDDICDSGVTLANFYETYQDEFAFPFYLKTAVLHYKPQTSVFEPTLFANQWSSNNWIIYPWERKDSKSIQDYKI